MKFDLTELKNALDSGLKGSGSFLTTETMKKAIDNAWKTFEAKTQSYCPRDSKKELDPRDDRDNGESKQSS